MLSRQKFYGGAYGIVSGSPTLRKGAPRVIDISNVDNGTNAASVTLPDKTTLQPGGPYFYFVNHGTRTIGLKDGSSTFWNVPPGNTATVVLGTTKWWAFMDVTGTAKSVASNGGVVRTVPVGYVPPPTTVTQPTEYDPILCDGGYRRARICGDGALVNIWMLDEDVDPHFTAGVAVFKYQEVCYYFKMSDRVEVGHGFTLAGTDVTWYTDCDTCNGVAPPPPPPPPVPCVLPTGLPTAFALDFHAKARFDPGPAGYGQDCIPSCEADISITLTATTSPGQWESTSYVVCSKTYPAIPTTITQTNPGVDLYWVNDGSGSCYWELFFTDGNGTCRSVFRKYTGLTPAGSDWTQVDPYPVWVCGSDGDTHAICVAAGYDAITSPVVS